jgi:muramoyltetrapeptide carboxypeptidase LdcA involved in peptidoglycan recycling
MEFKSFPKLKKGDQVAVLSPSFASSGKFPHVHELGLTRLRGVFGLEPIEYPTTRKHGASVEERSRDLMDAFFNPEIKAVIATIGGNDQVTYIKNLPQEPFIQNPKPFFGFSDNTHFENFLWLNGIPSFYGGSILTQFAMQKKMDEFTIKYLQYALFESGERELEASPAYNDIGLDWKDSANLEKERTYEENKGWRWDGEADAEGISWGGCVESFDEILRHDLPIPSPEDFADVILFAETSEEVPSADYVFRVFRALGERGILAKIKGLLVGRPKAWEFNNRKNTDEKESYRAEQRAAILNAMRTYNLTAPVIQNMDFGHTDPQICLPYGGKIRVDSQNKKIFANF